MYDIERDVENVARNDYPTTLVVCDKDMELISVNIKAIQDLVKGKESLTVQLKEANDKISRYERKKDDAANVYAGLFRDYTTLQELFIAKEEEYKERIKELEAENQALKAEREGILGANEINKLFVEDLEEKQRIAIEALENARNFLVVHMGVHRNIILCDVEQALSRIRGK